MFLLLLVLLLVDLERFTYAAQTANDDIDLTSYLGDDIGQDSHRPSFATDENTKRYTVSISDKKKEPSIPNTKYKTTKNIKEVFIGRCYEYQFRKTISDDENSWNCEKLWEIFFNSFAYKGPCDVEMEDYKEFLDMVDEDMPKNKVLLWSGSREVAHKYSDFQFTQRFTTLEDTMAGYLVNDLKWCGSKDKPGINFDECPWECSIQSPYWAAANKKLAKKIRGVLHILLNGTRQHLIDRRIYPSYMKDRYYLGPVIIPELHKEHISRVIIMVGHTFHLKPLESCGEKTVKLLVDEIKKKGIPVECYNDTDVVKHILCVDDPLNSKCRLQNT